MTTEYKELDINLLDEHPDNPRIIYRDDVINSVAHEIELNGKEVLANDNALSVAPRNGRYIIYKGHHRFQGAKKSNLDTIYCWVNNDITDEEIYNALLLDNNQAELTPLERGKHAYNYTKKYSREGNSVSKYADRIDEKQPTVSKNKMGFESFIYCKKSIPRGILLQFAKQFQIDNKDENKWWSLIIEKSGISSYHFQLIHSLEKKEWWPWIAEKAIDSKPKWSSRELEEKIKGLKEIVDIPEVFNDWLKVEDIKVEVIKDPEHSFLINSLNNLQSGYNNCIEYMQGEQHIFIHRKKFEIHRIKNIELPKGLSPEAKSTLNDIESGKYNELNRNTNNDYL